MYSINIYLFILTSSGTVDFHSYGTSGVLVTERKTIQLTHSSIAPSAVFIPAYYDNSSGDILKLNVTSYSTRSFYIKLSGVSPTDSDITKSDYNFNVSDVNYDGHAKCKLLILN